MNSKKNLCISLKAIVDIALLVILIMLASYIIVSNKVHEILGIVFFSLFIIHNILNYKYYKLLFKRKYTLINIINLSLIIILFILIILNMISAIFVSIDIFSFIKTNNAALGRKLHLISTIYTFIFSSLHLGFNFNFFVILIQKKIKKNELAYKIFSYFFFFLFLSLAIYGLVCFINRELYKDMFLQVEFKFFNYEENKFKLFFDYFSMVILFAFLGYYHKKIIFYIKKRMNLKKRQGNLSK